MIHSLIVFGENHGQKNLFLLPFCAFLLFSIGCRSPEEKAIDERMEAQNEIGKAQENVQKTEADSARKILNADTFKEQQERKIDATEDLAKAHQEVDKEKMEASREIAAADKTVIADEMKK